MPRLIVRTQGGEKAYPLREGITVIGRRGASDIPLEDKACSRKHAEILVRGTQVTVQDAGSRNGTLLNGKLLKEPRLLSDGDMIRIGDCILLFEADAGGGNSTLRTARRSRQIVASIPEESVWAERNWEKFVVAARWLGLTAMLAACLGVVAGGAWIILRASTPPAAPPIQSMVPNSGFESGADPPWEAGEGGRLSIQIIQARSGQAALSIEKTNESPVLLVTTREPMLLEGGKQVDATAWVRTETFAGSIAFRIVWLDRSGRFLLEDASPPVGEMREWKRLTAAFVPPRGAWSFQLGFLLEGSSGRVTVDDVMVLNNRTFSEPTAPERVGEFSFLKSRRHSNLVLFWNTLPVIVPLSAELVTAKGPLPVIFDTEVNSRLGEGGKGVRMEGSVAGARIGLTRTLASKGVSLEVTDSYRVEGALGLTALRARMRFPLATEFKIGGGEGDKAFVRVGDLEFSLEFPPTVALSATSDGTPELAASIPVSAGAFELSWRMQEMASSRQFRIKRLREEIQRFRDLQQWGRLRDRLRDLARETEEPEEVRALNEEIERINESEEKRWHELRLEGSLAFLSGAPDRAEESLRNIRTFLEDYPNPRFAEAITALINQLSSLLMERAVDLETGKKFLESGKVLVQRGKRALGKCILEFVERQWEGTELSREARTLREGVE